VLVQCVVVIVPFHIYLFHVCIARMHTCTYANVYGRVPGNVLLCACEYICVHVYTKLNVYIYTYTYM